MREGGIKRIAFMRHINSVVPIEYRVCVLCQKAKVEDEILFLCECEVYEDERKPLKRICKK